MKKLKVLADVSACYAVLRSCKVPPRSNQVIEPRFRGLMALELQKKYQCILAEPENFLRLSLFYFCRGTILLFRMATLMGK